MMPVGFGYKHLALFLQGLKTESHLRPGMTTPCWNWQKYRDKRGYGQLKAGRVWWIHRLAYVLYVGPIPAAGDIHHRCHNQGCANPDHLEAMPANTHAGLSNDHRWHNGSDGGDGDDGGGDSPY